MSVPYKLATFAYRGHTCTAVEVGGLLIDLNVGYEHFKARTGRRDFFKARHNYTVLDVLEEWDLFLSAFEDMATFYAPGGGAAAAELPFVYHPEEVRFLPPILYPNKILNAGANFYDHSLEMGAAAPDPVHQEPYFFYKGSRHTVIGSGDTIRLTPRSNHIDWEAELAVVIGRTASNVPVDKAMDYVAGYTCYNDISARDRMIRTNETFDYDWFANKGNDTFAPLGPYITPAKFIKDPHNLTVRCYLNGEVMQDYSTSNMVFSIPQLIANASSITTLSPGDVIATGTGAGVGMAKGVKVKHGEIHKVFEHMYAGKSRMLRSGDRIVVDIEGIGRLENRVAAVIPSA